MLNHSGTLWWGAGNRMAATPHSLWSLLFGLRFTHKITYFWAAKDPTAHQPPHFFRQQLQTSTCTNWSNWSTPADPSCQTSTFTTTIMAASTAASILKGKHGCFYHSPHYQVLVKSLELLTKATTSAFLPRSNFLLPVTAQELISPWAWDKGTATSVRPQVPTRGQEGAPLLQTQGEGSVLQAEDYWSDSFQMGDVWLRGRRLFLGTASVGSRWTHNSPPLPAPGATLAAQLPTEQHAVQLRPTQHRQRLLLSAQRSPPSEGPPLHRSSSTTQECLGWVLVSTSLPSHQPFLKPLPSHCVSKQSTIQHRPSDVLWVSHSRRAAAGLESFQRLFA